MTSFCTKCSFLPPLATGATVVPGNLREPPATSGQILVASGQPPRTSRHLRGTSGEPPGKSSEYIILALLLEPHLPWSFLVKIVIARCMQPKNSRFCSKRMESMMLAKVRCRGVFWVMQPKRTTSTNNVTPTQTMEVIWLEQSLVACLVFFVDECAPH